MTLLPRDLVAAELPAARRLGSIDALLIDDLSDGEVDAFAAASPRRLVVDIIDGTMHIGKRRHLLSNI